MGLTISITSPFVRQRSIVLNIKRKLLADNNFLFMFINDDPFFPAIHGLKKLNCFVCQFFSLSLLLFEEFCLNCPFCSLLMSSL